MGAGVLEGGGYDVVDVAAAVGEGEFVAVVVLEGLEQAGLGSDDVIHFEVVEQDLSEEGVTWRVG